jgi:acetyl esterase/lipase
MELSRIAPELRKQVRRFPTMPVESEWFRRLSRLALPLMRSVTFPGVVIEQAIPGAPGVRVHRPEQVRSRAALLWIHGGGLVMGAAKQDDRICGGTAAELGIVVVAADYRLAPRFPFPTPLDDCRTVWTWLLRNAARLGVDPGRVIVGGQSAGGGLAAALAQRLYDEGGVQPVAQWLFCPMLDDRTAARHELDEIGHRVWNNRHNRYGWAAYLRSEPGQRDPDGTDPGRTDPGGMEPGRTNRDRTDLGAEDPSRTEPDRTNRGAEDPDRTDPGRSNRGAENPDRTDQGRINLGAEDPNRTEPDRTAPGTKDSSRTEPGREKANGTKGGGTKAVGEKTRGEKAGLKEPPIYAVPARREDLTGLPPAWIGVGDVDLFHDEDLAYAERLRAAGVPATFHAVPGAPHGFEAWAPNTMISRDFVHAGRQWLSRFAG